MTENEVQYPKGNCKHVVCVSTCDYDTHGERRCPEERDRYDHPPVVWIANDNDGYYGECFTSKRSINGLITRLKNARDKAWPIG